MPAQAAWFFTLERMMADAALLLADVDAPPLLRMQPAFDLLDKADSLLTRRGQSADAALIRIGGETVNAAAVRELLGAAHGRHARLQYPHPRADLQPGMGAHGIVSLYSDERLIEHVTSVWEKAIRAYEELVEAEFTAVSNRLSHYVTLPARYVGFITPNRGQEAAGPAGMPLLSGYFEPLPLGEPSRVELQLSDLGWRIPFRPEAMDQFRRLRPQAVRWSGAPGGSRVLSLSGRTPSTNLAYEWLWQDLSSTRMVTGTRPGAGRYR